MYGKSDIANIDNVKGVRIVRLSGAFTRDTTPRICSMIKNESMEIRGVVLDFNDIHDIDSTAFACMVDVIRRHIKDGVGVGVINLSQEGRSLLEVLKIEKIIDIFDSEEDAVEGLLVRWS